jgi:hypothetical protein
MAYSLSPLPEPLSAGIILYALRDNSLIEERDFSDLTQALSVRNALAHGKFSDVEAGTQDVENLADLAVALNSSATSGAVELLDETLSSTPITAELRPEYVQQLMNNRSKQYAAEIVARATGILRELTSSD